MDEFKPEDELKPDTSDRRPTRPRKTSSAPKVPVSRQHMMMAIGILVLILLVVGIGSALKSPESGSTASQNGTRPAAGGAEKSIDLSGSSSMSGTSTSAATAEGQQAASQGSSPQELSAPQIASSPTEAQTLPTPQNQQRVELPGDLNSALSSQQGQVDVAAQGGTTDTTLPVAPATVVAGAGSRALTGKSVTGAPVTAPQTSQPAATHRAASSRPAHSEGKPQATARSATRPASSSTSAGRSTTHSGSSTASRAPAASGSTPGGNFTLQLSSASRSDTLNAWAKKQNLNGYHVYQTTRNGQPWYVLVSGSYATSADAKRAVATLPAEVRAQNPWVKPVSQVKKEAGK